MPKTKGFIQGFLDFQHYTISVSNIEKSLSFYRDLLGFPVLGRLNYHNKVGLMIYFLDIGNNAILEMFGFQVPTKPSDRIADDLQLGIRHVGFKVKDVDEIALRLKSANVPFTMEPLDAHGGVRIAFFKDPDGILLEIIQGELHYDQNIHSRLPSPSPLIKSGNGDLSFDHITLTASDLEKALAFYEGALGFPVLGQLVNEDDQRGFLITYLQAGNSVLELFSFTVPTIPHTWNPEEIVLGFRHMGFLVSDVDSVAQRLGRAGVRILYPPTEAQGKVKTCFFVDPDGNALELIDGTVTYDE
ncbi:MAG: VOC family protein [Anaerolineales bacterium]|jgi:catechol 2,3-dioxygenase-like lactoylglutathione lyase family enzyme